MAEAVRANGLMVSAGVVGVIATVLVVASPDVPLVVRGAALQAVVETAGGVATLAAALMVYGRFRTNPTLGAGILYAALLMFGLTNLLLAAVPAAFPTLGDAFDTWAALGGRLTATLLFAAAPFVRTKRRISGWVPVLATVAVITALAVMAELAGQRLPAAVHLEGDITEVGDLRAHPLVVAVNVAGLIAFLTAAWGFASRPDDPFFQALAGASVLGAFSRLHLALVPSLYSGAVYSGDVFRLAYHAAVLAAAVGEIVRYWRDREALAVADERRRVARELHDGVAQELAFIATTTTRMEAVRHDEDVSLIASAARRALAESRRAIATLTRPLDEPLPQALAEALSELANRTGGRVEVDLDATITVSPAQREELLRIAREAVSNALRHAGTDAVHVTLRGGPPIVLRIADHGRGFDPDTPGNPHGFGVTSMRERAAALGATFELTSRPGAGTTITVTL